MGGGGVLGLLTNANRGEGGVKGMLTLAGDGSGPEFFYMKLLHYNPLSEGSKKAESAKQDFSFMFY